MNLLLAILVAAPLGARPHPVDVSPGCTDESVVRVVLFFSPTCPHCHAVMERHLPPLQRRWGTGLEILEVDVTTGPGQELYRSAVAGLNLPEDRIGVPTVVIGEAVLVGSGEIPQRLPGLVETAMAAGGVDWPAIPGLSSFRAPRRPALPGDTVVPVGLDEPGTASGLPLAWAVLGFLVLSLLRALRGVRKVQRSGRGFRARRDRGTLLRASPFLVAGVVTAGYLSWAALTRAPVVCGPMGDCARVHASPFAHILSVPVAPLGLVGYLLLSTLWIHPRWADRWPGALPAVAVAGTSFSLYLTAMEIWILRAVCPWCLASAGAMGAVLWIMVSRSEAGAPDRPPSGKRSHGPQPEPRRRRAT